MYLPPAFAETRTEVLRSAIGSHPLALLVTLNASGLEAGHVPLLLDPEPAPHGRLLGHRARQPPVAQSPAGDRAGVQAGLAGTAVGALMADLEAGRGDPAA
jgi:predicted FMN-binding regulatory protein PaiB